MYAHTHTQIYLFQRDHSDGQAQTGDHYDMYLPFVTMAF